MINILLGRPGSGKSYEAVVYHILPALESGRMIVTNLPLNLEFIKTVKPEYIDLIVILDFNLQSGRPFSKLEHYKYDWRNSKGQSVYFVIDECHLALPNGGTAREIEEFFSMHRHHGYDILLITQSVSKISRSIREMIQTVYRVSNNRTLGSDSSYIQKTLDGVRGEVLSTKLRRYDVNKFKYYRSHTQTNSAVSEASVSDVRPIYYHWSFVGAAVFLVIGIALLSSIRMPFNVAKTNDNIKKIEQSQASSKPLETKKTIPSINQPSVIKEPKVQNLEPFSAVQLHIAGFMQSKKKTMYQFVATQNGQPVFYVSHNDMLFAGYKIQPLGGCTAKLTYQTRVFYLTCDFPRVTPISTPSGITGTYAQN